MLWAAVAEGGVDELVALASSEVDVGAFPTQESPAQH